MARGRQTSESREARRTDRRKRRRQTMAREDIEKMIADAIGETEEPRKPAVGKPLPHAQHILDQYAALCRTEECTDAEPSGDVELPAAPADRPASSELPNRLSSIVKRAIGRVKR